MSKLVNSIIQGDCIEVLNEIDKPVADLIFADPPFNIGYKYDKYYDRVKSKNYIAWTQTWMKACKKVLKPNGSFYIAIGDDYAANVKTIADEIGLTMRNWIIWHYTFGQQTTKKFARSHTHIFYFVNDKGNFTFNDHAVGIPSDRQLLYNDKRANPKGKMPDDVWNQYFRVCGTFKERAQWHPCQMPESLLRRIIMASSNLKDCVLDPFSGSGTTAAAAIQLDRKYIGIDMSKQYVENCRKRLEELKKLTANQKRDILLTQLLIDMKLSSAEIVSDKKLLTLFANQFSVRTNNDQPCDITMIEKSLKDLAI